MKDFKNRLLLLTSAFALSTTAFAATTGNLLLQGLIGQELSIIVTPDASATSLDLTANVIDLKVATVSESSNSSSGYKITVSSLNNGSLVNGSDTFSYSMKYAGSAVSLSTTAQDAKVQTVAGVYNSDSNVEISYTGQAATSLLQGTYSDQLTFTIIAN